MGGLEYGSLQGALSVESDSSNSIAIGSINISTNQLNTSQDFRSAGQIFAEEFAKAIRQRGINTNVKK